jgi:Ca-activated chloride channel family protein
MTAEERDARLTAYALGDASLSPSSRQEIETLLAGDPAARRAVEETRQLASVLTKGLHAEEAAMKPESVVTIPAPKARQSAWWAGPVVAASVVLVAGCVIFFGTNRKNDRSEFQSVASSETPRPASATTQMAQGTGLDATKYTYSDPSTPDTSKGDKKPSAEGAIIPVTGDSSTGAARPSGPSTVPSPEPSAKPDPRIPVMPALPGGGPPANRGAFRPGMPGLPGPVVTTGPRLPGSSLPGTPPGDLPPAESAPRGDVRDTEAEVPSPNDRYPQLHENSFIKVEGLNALSTFGVDVDTASYAIVRKYLTMGQLPPANAVRLEEMVNYFPYRDKAPEGDDPFAVSVEMADCPWAPTHRLVRLGLKAKPIAVDKRPVSNIVFLIDVSGSMNEPNKLPLVKESLKLLVNQLGENDRVAIVVYAGASGLVLDSTSAMNKEKILNSLDQLSAGGSTNGEGGIHQAYDVAIKNFIKGGTNRVVLCTDGDWNVGTTSTEALVKLIEQKRESGVFLSIFGFGMGNLRDEMMVKLAGKGNGNYGYIDTIKEANKALVEQLGGTLVTVAKDVKIQVEFNPAVVNSYRLLGYEKRALAAKDFHDDKKDAGEMGAGHVVTALYELVPVGAADPVVGKVDGLRYQADPAPAKPAVKDDKAKEAFVVKMRHKKPDSDKSTLREVPVSNVTVGYEKASEDFQFAASVASFAMLLRDSAHKGNSNFGLVLELAEAAKKHDPSGYRAEFIELVRKAKSLSAKP